jgi:hypothetical protein
MEKKVYISGKMKGLSVEEITTKFQNAESELRKMGFKPVNPLDNGISGYDYKKHMRADIKMLLECDAICMLPCWTDSRGATLEKEIAEATGIEVMYY